MITSQPQGATVNASSTLALTVAATGTPTPTYQWRKDGVAIADTRSKTTGKAKGSVVRGPGPDGVFLITYDLPPVDNNSDGVYDLLVDNGANFLGG